MESTQSYRVGWIPLKRRPTPWLTLFAGLSTEGRVESTQSYRVLSVECINKRAHSMVDTVR